jgi:hypothetical protein
MNPGLIDTSLDLSGQVPRQLPRIMQNPEYLYNVTTHSVEQDVPGLSNPLAPCSATAEFKMPGAQTCVSGRPGTRPLRIFFEIAERLIDESFISQRGVFSEFISAASKYRDEIPARGNCGARPVPPSLSHAFNLRSVLRGDLAAASLPAARTKSLMS